MNRSQPLESIVDLGSLGNVSDDTIVACLRERFMSDTIYTDVGSSALVALNPHKYVSTSSDAVMHKYAANYRDTAEDKEQLPPHIFQLANNAYYHMRRTTQDQAIVFTFVPLLHLNFTDLFAAEKRPAESRKTAVSPLKRC
jgi:chitin synthase